MRLILYTLLAANLAMLLWGLWIGPGSALPGDGSPPDSAPERGLPPGVSVVRLLSGTALDLRTEAGPGRNLDTAFQVRRCYTLGPVASAQAAELIADRIRASAAEVILFNRDGELQQDYWVLLPPQPSRQEALLKFREFQSRNIDSFVVTQGHLENAISLGLFTRRALAQELALQLKAMGYPQVAVREVPRENQEIWLRVTHFPANATDGLPWDEILEGNRGVSRRESACDQALLSPAPALPFVSAVST